MNAIPLVFTCTSLTVGLWLTASFTTPAEPTLYAAPGDMSSPVDRAGLPIPVGPEHPHSHRLGARSTATPPLPTHSSQPDGVPLSPTVILELAQPSQ